MRKPDLTVRCTDEERRLEPALYKVAAEWVGGGYSELKTYGFADDVCLERVFRKAADRIRKVRLSEGETVSPLRIYRLEPARHDWELPRMTELELSLNALVEREQPVGVA